MRLTILFCSLLFIAVSHSFGFEVDGIYYGVSNGTAAVSYPPQGAYSGIVNIPSTVTYNGQTYKVTLIGDLAFQNCTELSYVFLPESLEKIGSRAFEGCTKLVSLKIPEGTTTIESSAFRGCTGLQQINLPNSLKSLGSYSFENCYSLKSISIPEGVSTIYDGTFSSCSSLEKVTMGRVKVIGDYAFYFCHALSSIDFSSSLNRIGGQAFRACSSLNSVVVSDDCILEGGAFYDCSSLTSVTFLGNVFFENFLAGITVHTSVFDGCNRLSAVHISSLEQWCNINFPHKRCNPLCNGAYLYVDGEKIVDLVIPNTISTIPDFSFEGSAIKSVTFSENVSSIGTYAFSDCRSLETVIIKKGMTSIGDFAFSGCSLLDSVICYCLAPPTLNQWSLYQSNGAVLHVLPTLAEVYSKAQYYSSSFSKIVDDAIGVSVTYIAFDKSSYAVKTGAAGKVIATVYPEDASVKDLEWSNSNESVLYVDQKGQFVGLSIGEAVITATAKDRSGVQASAVVYVTEDGVNPNPNDDPNPLPKCDAPSISYENGKLYLSSKTEGAICYYSTSAASLSAKDFRQYEQDSDLSNTLKVTVSAYATAKGYVKSDISTVLIDMPVGAYITQVETVYVDVPYEVIEYDTVLVPTNQVIPAPTIVVNNGKAEIISGLENAAIYYTIDGTEPIVQERILYSGSISVSGDCTIRAIAVLQSEEASKEIVDGVWNRISEEATLRYYRADGIETKSLAPGINIVESLTPDGTIHVRKKYMK